MQGSLRVFVERARANGEWTRFPVPHALRGLSCHELKPFSAGFRHFLRSGHYFVLPEEFPSDCPSLSLFEEGHCSNPACIGLEPFLNTPWDRLPPANASPLFSRPDMHSTAKREYADDLILVENIAAREDWPSFRLVMWDEPY